MLKAKQRKKITFEIAIAGMSTAFVVVCLALAFYSPVAKISFFALSGVALMLPIIGGSLWGAVMAYLAGGGLALLFSPINVVPFAFIFGLQVILMELCKRFFKNKWYICIPLKLVIFNVALYGVFKLYGLDSVINVFIKIGWDFKYIYAALIASPIFVLYDYVFQGVYKWLTKRLYKITSKYNPNAESTKNAENQKKEPDSHTITFDKQDKPFETEDIFDFGNDSNFDNKVNDKIDDSKKNTDSVNNKKSDI